MPIGWLLDRMKKSQEKEAIIWKEQSFSYSYLLEKVDFWRSNLSENNIASGEVVVLDADYSPNTCALLLALIENRNIIVPLASSVESQKKEFIQIAEVQKIYRFDSSDNLTVNNLVREVKNPLLRKLQAEGIPGLVLFSSGSTGKPKAALHNFKKILEKFIAPRPALRTITFLLFDHIGGINTLFHTLSNGGCVAFVTERDPEHICQIIERRKIELLPTSPTFLNLLLISEQYKYFDLSSLKIISYGTEVMPESTLEKLHQIFPNVRLHQTYGLSEVGILRSKSKDSGSLWFKVGGEGYQTKIVDGILYIKADSAMLGYLNAPSPFDEDGWLNTNDQVEIDGEYIRIKGRKSEIINVGGEKVYPSEVESVLMEIDNIIDVTISGEANPIMGNIVVANVNLAHPEDKISLKRRIRAYCKDRLAPYKIPVKISIVSEQQFGDRYKKLRR